MCGEKQGQKKSLRDVAKNLYLAIAFLKECNYKCGYCHPFGESKVTSGQNLSEKEIKEVISAAIDSDFKTFRFTGGECTLVPWFASIIKFILEKKSSIRINICTNGTTLKKHLNLFEKYKENISLRISLDSTNQRHRAFGFNKILTDELLQSLQELSKRKIPTRFNTVVTQQNKKEVYKIIDLACDLNFDVKLLDIYVQEEYNATNCNDVANQKEQIGALKYWQENYVNLNELVPEFEKNSYE